MNNDYLKILGLIQSVDPNDESVMDEIDSRVGVYVRKIEYVSHCRTDGGLPLIIQGIGQPPFLNSELHLFEQYTRSHDAQQAIIPEGWGYFCGYRYDHDNKGTPMPFAGLRQHTQGIENYQTYSDQKTQLLSALHAIIQAIEYERSKA